MTLQDFFEILYADSSAAKAFHKEVDKDENTKVLPLSTVKRTLCLILTENAKFCSPWIWRCFAKSTLY